MEIHPAIAAMKYAVDALDSIAEQVTIPKGTMAHEQLREVVALANRAETLRAANARLQAWHDAVMGQERHSLAAVPYAYSPGFVPPEHAMTIKTVELIIRPQPLAKE